MSALCASIVCAVSQREPQARITVFDHGRGERSGQLQLPDRTVDYARCGAVLSRRYYRQECLWNVRLSAWLGGLGNPTARALLDADAVLDISGGDSFTDLYGPKRFRTVTMPKLMTLEQEKRLVLLPQTYGPYNTREARRLAERIVRGAAAAWARDERSFGALRELLAGDYDPSRHGCGVDVAFGLHATPPVELPDRLRSWLEDRETPLAGVNVSGLIYNDPAGAAGRYGFRADYRQVLVRLLRRLLRETECRILLIPHVFPPSGYAVESDPAANESLAALLRDEAADRLLMLPGWREPGETKWLISQLDWFCGTRMHSTIAGLSSGVPTAAIAYSIKTAGVFETCGQGEHVADPRAADTETVLERLWASWCAQRRSRAELAAALPGVLNQAEVQMDQIVAACAGRSLAARQALELMSEAVR